MRLPRTAIRGSMAEGAQAYPDAFIDRPLRLFAQPEPVEAIAAVPDGPPLRFRWRRAHAPRRPRRGTGAHRAGMVARRRPHPRLFPRRGFNDGHRFWLFREGLYGRETTAPRWYLHGVFG